MNEDAPALEREAGYFHALFFRRQMPEVVMRRYVTANAEGFREGDAEFDALHKSFHVALIAACGSPRMLAALSDLYDQAYRYRRLMVADFRESTEFLAAHDQLAELAIARRRGEAEQAIGFHIAATLRHVYPEAANATR